jgi:hypothetical protein
VRALLLAAVRRTGREASVARAAHHLVAVRLAGQNLQTGLNNTTTETEHKVQGRLLLDVVVGKGAAVLELLAGEDETLLIRGNSWSLRQLLSLLSPPPRGGRWGWRHLKKGDAK